MQLETSHLELLAALTTNSTLAAASAAINLSPSAASRRLSDAEQLLGLALVTKDGRTLRLTPAGRILADAAVRATTQLTEAELAARWLGQPGRSRPLRIGVWFHDAISWLLPAFEDQPFEVIRAPVDRPRRADFGTVDLTIDVVGAEVAGDAILADDQLALIAAADHPLSTATAVPASALVDLTYFAGSTDPIPGFEFERFFLPSGDCPTDIVSIDTLPLLLDLVSRGEGLTIQPERAIRSLNRTDLTILAIDRPIPVRWVARRSATADDRADRFIDLACAAAMRTSS